MAENLVQNFQDLIKHVEEERTVLKCMTNMRDIAHSNCPTDIKAKLCRVEEALCQLEEYSSDFETYLDGEIAALRSLHQLNQYVEKQKQDISNLGNNLPAFFQQPSASSTDKQSLLLIEKEEFEAVPRSTRSRVTLTQIIEALGLINTMTKTKLNNINLIKKKKKPASPEYEEYYRLLHTDHQDKMFLTKREIRTTSVFESGEATGRAVLHTLRALKRIRMIKKRKVCTPLPCFAGGEEEEELDVVDGRDYRTEGSILAEAGDMEGALHLWQMGLNIRPADHILLELKAQALLSLDHYFLAIQSAEACIRSAPEWSVGYLTLARAQRQFGEIELALRSAEKAKSLDPHDIDITHEILEIKVLVDRLRSARLEEESKLHSCNTADEREVQRCMIHLLARTPIAKVDRLEDV